MWYVRLHVVFHMTVGAQLQLCESVHGMGVSVVRQLLRPSTELRSDSDDRLS